MWLRKRGPGTIEYNCLKVRAKSLPVCEILPSVSWAQRPLHWPKRTGPWGQRPQRKVVQSRAKRNSCADNHRHLRIPRAKCLSWCRSSYRLWQYGTVSRKPCQRSGSERARQGLGMDEIHRILARLIKWANFNTTSNRVLKVPWTHFKHCQWSFSTLWEVGNFMWCLPRRPNISTPRAAKMKNNRKKSKPKFPTWGRACITVSSRARIPLAIFNNFKTVKGAELENNQKRSKQ